MPELIVTHEVDDVAHWTASPRARRGSGGVAHDIRTFVDPSRSNQVGLGMDVSDMAAFQAVMESEAGVEALRYDGVRRVTLVTYLES